MSDFDHGILNLPLGSRGRGKSIERTIDDAIAELRREAREKAETDKARRKAARRAEAVRPKLTRADIDGAKCVRDAHGWHEVVRVSAKSVTVKTQWSWTERIEHERVLEVRR